MQRIHSQSQEVRAASRAAVLFVSHDASLSGAPIFLLRFLRWLKEHEDIDIRILVGRPGPMLADFEAIGPTDTLVPRFSIFYRLLRRIGLAARLEARHFARVTARLAGQRIRLVYGNSIASGNIVEKLSFLDCPVICHAHELQGAIEIVGTENLDALAKRASKFIAVSGAVAENLIQRHHIESERIQTVYGFIPSEDGSGPSDGSSVKSMHAELGIGGDIRIVCGCGTIEPRKGTDLFLEIAEHVSMMNEGPPVLFIWIGGSKQTSGEMQARANASKAAGCLRFVGPKPNPSAYFQISDLFLVTSREDPFPLTMLEAALHGNPILCFEGSGGASEFVAEDAGAVVPSFDTQAMARKVLEILSQPSLQREMGEAGRQKVMERHNLDAGARRVATLMFDLMGPDRSRPG